MKILSPVSYTEKDSRQAVTEAEPQIEARLLLQDGPGVGVARTNGDWGFLLECLLRVPHGHGKSWNLGRPFSRPGKSWKIAKVMESHGK